MTTASLTDARDRFSEIVDEVAATGTEYTITKHGKPVAVVLSYDEYESLIETVNILSDTDTLAALGEADADVAEGNVGDV